MRNHWIAKQWRLQISTEIWIDPDSFMSGEMLVVSKGPYQVKTRTDTLRDMKDYFNLDSSFEMAHIMLQELCHYENFMFGPDRKQRVKVSKEEVMELVEAIRKYRETK